MILYGGRRRVTYRLRTKEKEEEGETEKPPRTEFWIASILLTICILMGFEWASNAKIIIFCIFYLNFRSVSCNREICKEKWSKSECQKSWIQVAKLIWRSQVRLKNFCRCHLLVSFWADSELNKVGQVRNYVITKLKLKLQS